MTVRSNILAAGEVKSCGCLKKEQEQKNLAHGINLIDLTGKKFGLLTVLTRDETAEDDKHDVRWKCQCKCGNIKTIRGSSLRSGATISCGCLKESYGEYKIKENIVSVWSKDGVSIHASACLFDSCISLELCHTSF